MRRWEAEIGLASGEGLEVEGIGLAADERPAASDPPFENFGDQHREQHRQEQVTGSRRKAEPSCTRRIA